MTTLAAFRAIVPMTIAFLSALPLHAGILNGMGYEVLGDSITISSSEVDIAGHLVIPETIEGKPVTSIGRSAFYGRQKIKSLSLPSSLTSIGPHAFHACRDLTRVNIPSGVATIGEYAFMSCGQLTDLTISFGVITIGNHAFARCHSLQKVIIPGSVVEIGDSAFSYCKNLSDLELPPSVTTLGDSAFLYCGFTNFLIPATVTTFGSGIFSSCLQLKEVTFSSGGLTDIPLRMFMGCERLESVRLPPSVTRIGPYAFAESGLESIEFGTSVKYIEEWAFFECNALRLAVIPPSVREIAAHAFSSCGKLEAVNFSGKAPMLGKEVFSDVSPGFRIFIDASAKGFTIPRWQGYRTSPPAPEIAVYFKGDASLRDGESFGRFGSLLVGNGRKVVRFEIQNVGNLQLRGLDAMIDGTDSGDFTVKNLSKASIAPGKTATLEIIFAPKQNGKRLARLRVASNDSNEDPFDIELSGRGLSLLE